jgi:hypothetical protein
VVYSLQIFDFKGLIRKIFRNKDLGDIGCQLSILGKSFDMVLSLWSGGVGVKSNDLIGGR